MKWTNLDWDARPPLVTVGVEHCLGAEVVELPHRLHLGDEAVGELVPAVEGHPPLVARAEPLLEALRNVLHSHVVLLGLANKRIRIFMMGLYYSIVGYFVNILII